jgi:hypothetical protein
MVLELGAVAAHDRGRTADEAYFMHQRGTRWLLLGERERGEQQLLRALALRRERGDRVASAATRHNLEVLRDEDHALPLAAGAVGAGAVGAGAGGAAALGRGPSWLGHGVGRWLFGAVGLALGVVLGLLVGSGGGNSNPAATHVLFRTPSVRTVVLPQRTVTRPGRIVTQVRQTAPVAAPSSTVTVSAPAGTVTRTVAGSEVTVATARPAVTVTRLTPAPTRTITNFMTRTVTAVRTVPTTVCIDCKP